MEIVTAIVTPVVQSLMVPVKNHLGYLISCTKYVRDMGTRKRTLDAKRVDVEQHMNRNERNILVVPAEARDWLGKVVEIDGKVASISSDGGSCFNIKRRHKLGRQAFKIIEEINGLIEENSKINWTDHPIPLGKVDSKKASTSIPSNHHNDFPSRERTFMDALKQLQPDHKSQMIALCGMGGVGKTTMMEKLKKAAEEKKLFNTVVKVVIGEKTNTIAIQDAIADYLGISLTEKSESARSDMLHKSFEVHSDGGKNKILVILDDVWQFVNLNDMGLSPLPNQGVGFKILLTSRLRDVCTRMDVDLIFNVETIEDQEAQSFFHQCVQVPDGDDLDFDLCEIGKDIANRCHGLPIAIKTVASFLKCYRTNKQVWEDTLSSLKNKKVDEVVHQIFETSYNNLQNEEIRSTLLLCGLFPEDFDTPREDLVRYGWGLKLLKDVHTIREARNRVNTYIEQLINANLLIGSQLDNHVKMHDLVRAFVLKVCSNTEHASIVGDISKWTEENTSEFCKRISLTCTGMSEFPRNFKFPNLSFLKLMRGDESLKFPEDFYREMKKLQVVAYDNMENPLLSRSLECCTNLRTLCLYQCSLMFDCSSIGNLSNLEVLNFANCDIRKLPSTIGHLRKLKLLDLTYCHHLCIDDGLLKKLVNLEELYMRLDRREGIRFINDNAFNELVECSKNLTALEIELFGKNAPPKNISFQKIERFKISIGCFRLWNYKGHAFENMLSLATNKDEIPESIMYHLLKKTEVLLLNVAGMSDLQGMFHNLRVLNVSGCVDLRYLFTLGVAKTLSKLERLYITSCQSMTELIHIEKGGSETIQFPNLKFLYLHGLRNMLSLCNTMNAIELPQLMELSLDRLPTFTSIYSNNKLATSSMSGNISQKQHALIEQAVIPKLEKLHISNMDNLKEIWPCEFEVDDCILREIIVKQCDNLVNLFPSNPMSLLHHLEELEVKNCGSIEVLFNIDLGCNIEEVSCCLTSIQVQELENLREVWRVKGANDSDLVIRGFQALESLKIKGCKRFRNVFTPTTTNFDMKSLTDLYISYSGESELVKSMQEQEINVAFPSYLIHTFHNLHILEIINDRRTEVVFEIESSPSSSRRVELATTPQQPPLLPYLKDLNLQNMKCMSHVWKCNWNKFLIPRQQESFSSFHNLTTIELKKGKNIKYLFSPLMAKLLSNLKNVMIHECDVIEEVVSNRDDEDEGVAASTDSSPNLFPHLDLLNLENLRNLKRIGGGGGAKGGSNEIFNNTTPSTSNIHDQFEVSQVDVVAWSLCQYARKINIQSCQALPYVIPSYALGQMQKLEKLTIWSCESLLEVFETQGINNNGCCTTNIDEVSGGTDATMLIPRLQNISVPQLSNLKKLEIVYCDLLQHVFTFSTIESLVQLQKLRIRGCNAMEVIVKVDDEEQTTISSKIVVFPRLKSIELANLPNLTGFFLGKNEFQLPLLDHVRIDGCPKMMVFTSGSSITPQLNNIHTKFGKYSLECGLNFPVMAATLHKRPFSSLDTTKSRATTSEKTPWLYFDNLIETDVKNNYKVKKIVPSNELQQLQKLEKIQVKWCTLVEEVFEALEGRDSNELQSVVVVEIPKLREVELERLKNLKYIWKNNPWMVLEFPNLTKLSIGGCDSLEHVFSSSMVGSLLQLQELSISDCAAVEVIVKEANVVVKEEERDGKVNVIIMLPQLKSLTLKKLPSLKGFCLGKEAFSWPSLDTLEINGCNAIRVFTIGHSTTPELKAIDTSFGRCELIKEQDLNSFINTKRQEGLEL